MGLQAAGCGWRCSAFCDLQVKEVECPKEVGTGKLVWEGYSGWSMTCESLALPFLSLRGTQRDKTKAPSKSYCRAFTKT